jgi:hypothetical protein
LIPARPGSARTRWGLRPQVPRTTPPGPVERIASLVQYLLLTVGPQYLGGPLGGRIPRPLILPISARIRNITGRFTRVAERIAAGTN